MRQSFAAVMRWVGIQLFRLLTALAVLGAFGYFWVNDPEYLTWWQHSVNGLIDAGSDELPYPWGDRVQSTVGNFGIWLQLTLAIVIVRAALGLAAILFRTAYRRRRSRW